MHEILSMMHILFIWMFSFDETQESIQRKGSKQKRWNDCCKHSATHVSGNFKWSSNKKSEKLEMKEIGLLPKWTVLFFYDFGSEVEYLWRCFPKKRSHCIDNEWELWRIEETNKKKSYISILHSKEECCTNRLLIEIAVLMFNKEKVK